MAADLPEHYEGKPTFEFIKDVPVDWSETRVLNAKIGDYITTVRKDKHSSNWYLGSITDEHAQEFAIPLTFLEPGKKYSAKIYADGTGADYKTNPLSITIEEKTVDSFTILPVKLAPGGGLVVSFKLME
jgi:alpha-glucosidase